MGTYAVYYDSYASLEPLYWLKTQVRWILNLFLNLKRFHVKQLTPGKKYMEHTQFSYKFGLKKRTLLYIITKANLPYVKFL